MNISLESRQFSSSTLMDGENLLACQSFSDMNDDDIEAELLLLQDSPTMNLQIIYSKRIIGHSCKVTHDVPEQSWFQAGLKSAGSTEANIPVATPVRALQKVADPPPKVQSFESASEKPVNWLHL